MIVILDTNIFVGDFQLAGTQFKLLFDMLPRVGGTLAVPEVVILETLNRFTETLREAVAVQAAANQTIARLTGNAGDATKLDVERYTSEYAQHLRDAITTIRGRILKIPDVDHTRIVERDLARKKPFGKSSGYRDYLIWHSVLLEAMIREEDIMFVSANSRDFAEGDGLHPDLVGDLRQRSSANVRLYGSLRSFNEEQLLPHARLSEGMKAALVSSGAAPVDLYQWIAGNIADLVSSEDLLQAGLGISGEYGEAGSPRLVGPPTIIVDRVHQTEDGIYLVKFRARVLVKYSVDFDWYDYVSSPDVREFLGEEEEPFGGAFFFQTSPVDITVECRFTQDPPGIEQYDVLEVRTPT